jgi:hypothetical protein
MRKSPSLPKSALQHPVWIRVVSIEVDPFSHGKKDDRVSPNFAGFTLDERLHPLCHLRRACVRDHLSKRLERLCRRSAEYRQFAILRACVRINRCEQLDMCHRWIDARAAHYHTHSCYPQPANGSLHCARSLSTLAADLGWQTAIHHKLLIFPPQPGGMVRSFYSLGVVIYAYPQVKLMTIWGDLWLMFSKSLIFLKFLFLSV